MLKKILTILFTLALLSANSNILISDKKPLEVAIWKTGKDLYKRSNKEIYTKGNLIVANKPITLIKKVEEANFTIYPAKNKNKDISIVVFPGGGYKVLAIDLEGSEVCEWLTEKGINCILLKYRVPFSGSYWDDKNHKRVIPKIPMALQDAQRTMGLLRYHSKEWNINPKKIGVLGFSAGGHLVADISTNFKNRSYKKIDLADGESCKPNFAISIYPGHMLENTKKEFELNPKIHVTKEIPPTFLLHAQDDPIDEVQNTLVYYNALKKADVPTELHIYAKGGHAFGLRKTKEPITDWTSLVEKWVDNLPL
ncbi:MAG: alpha/beta hydrolase [Candidatus Sericytochromatia bacterium]